jgi:hypothetical protein
MLICVVVVALYAYGCDGGADGDPTATATTAPSATEPAPTTAAETPIATSPDGLPAIVIEAPELGAIVDVPFEISGTANVFEAALTVQVLGEDGALVCEHNLTASAGSGTRGDWGTSMAFVPPAPPAGNAAVPMVVRALTYSAEDGSEQDVVTVEINVSDERPPNFITSPLCNAEVPAAPLEVTGVSDAFEGTLQLELQEYFSGDVVIEQTVQAAGGLGNAPFTATLDLSPLEAGLYRLVAFDFSAADGSRQNEFAIPIEVVLP